MPAYGQGNQEDKEESPPPAQTAILGIYIFLPPIAGCAYWRGLLFSQRLHFTFVCQLAPQWVGAVSESLWRYTGLSAFTRSDSLGQKLKYHPWISQPPSKVLSNILGKSNLQFAGMSISLTISTASLNLRTPDSKQVGGFPGPSGPEGGHPQGFPGWTSPGLPPQLTEPMQNLLAT